MSPPKRPKTIAEAIFGVPPTPEEELIRAKGREAAARVTIEQLKIVQAALREVVINGIRSEEIMEARHHIAVALDDAEIILMSPESL